MSRNLKIVTFLYITYLATVVILLVIPFSIKMGLEEYIFGIRKDHYVHATMFLPFTGYFWIANKVGDNFKKFLKFYGLGILFAACCEFLHYFIPYRTFDYRDFLANISGISIGSLIYLLKSPKL